MNRLWEDRLSSRKPGWGGGPVETGAEVRPPVRSDGDGERQSEPLTPTGGRCQVPSQERNFQKILIIVLLHSVVLVTKCVKNIPEILIILLQANNWWEVSRASCRGRYSECTYIVLFCLTTKQQPCKTQTTTWNPTKYPHNDLYCNIWYFWDRASFYTM